MVIVDQFRRSTRRLEGHDYAGVGRYFVTICTKNREHMLGEIRNVKMELNEMGKIVEEEITNTIIVRKNIQIDAFVIMPNHVHAIIVIAHRGDAACRGVMHYAPTDDASEKPAHLRSPSQTLGAIIRGIKSASLKRIRRLPGGFEGDLWQRNYHDRIVRTQEELNVCREYIRDNPQNWDKDDDNVEPHGMLPL